MKKLLYLLGGILLILVITNPSHEDFRGYIHIAPNNYQNRTSRNKNYFVCSLYTDDFNHQCILVFWVISIR